MWPTCGSSVMRKDTSKNVQNTTFDTNPNPAPTHCQLCPRKIRRFLFCLKKLVHHTKSHNIFLDIPGFPYFVLDNNSVVRQRLLCAAALFCDWCGGASQTGRQLAYTNHCFGYSVKLGSIAHRDKSSLSLTVSAQFFLEVRCRVRAVSLSLYYNCGQPL